MRHQSSNTPPGAQTVLSHGLRNLPWTILTAMLGILVIITLLQAPRQPRRADWNSLSIAATLIETGVYSNGGPTESGHPVTPGYNHPPGYPWLVALAGQIVPNLIDELNCLRTNRACPKNLTVNTVIGFQIIFATLALFLIFLLALELSNSEEIAILTLVLFFFNSHIGKFSLMLWPHSVMTTLAISSPYFIVLAFKRDNALFAVIAGILSGAAAYFNPSMALAPFIIAAVLFFILRRQPVKGLKLAIGLIAGAVLILTPWILRNYNQFGDLALTRNYSTQMLAQRVAYNNMSLTEWLAALLAWIPGVGDYLARLIFAPEIFDRLSYGHAQSIIVEDSGKILARSLDAAGPANAFWDILWERVIRQPFRYLASTPAVFLHGFWGSGSPIVLVGFVALFPLIKRLRRTGKIEPIALAFWSFTASVIALTLLTPNHHYFNDHMIAVYAYTIAHYTGGLELPPIFRRASIDTPT